MILHKPVLTQVELATHKAVIMKICKKHLFQMKLIMVRFSKPEELKMKMVLNLRKMFITKELLIEIIDKQRCHINNTMTKEIQVEYFNKFLLILFLLILYFIILTFIFVIKIFLIFVLVLATKFFIVLRLSFCL